LWRKFYTYPHSTSIHIPLKLVAKTEQESCLPTIENETKPQAIKMNNCSE
jgi:hypothetical protein